MTRVKVWHDLQERLEAEHKGIFVPVLVYPGHQSESEFAVGCNFSNPDISSMGNGEQEIKFDVLMSAQLRRDEKGNLGHLKTLESMVDDVAKYKQIIVDSVYDGKNFYVETNLNNLYSLVNEMRSYTAHFIDDFKIIRPAIKSQYVADIALGSKGYIQKYRDIWYYDIMNDIFSRMSNMGSRERYALGYWQIMCFACGIPVGYDALIFDNLSINSSTMTEAVAQVQAFIIDNYKVLVGDYDYKTQKDKAQHAKYLAQDFANTLCLAACFIETRNHIENVRDIATIHLKPQGEFPTEFTSDTMYNWGVETTEGNQRLTFIKLKNYLPKLQTLHKMYPRDITVVDNHDKITPTWNSGVVITKYGYVKLPKAEDKKIWIIPELEGAGMIAITQPAIDNIWKDIYRIGKQNSTSTGWAPLYFRMLFGRPSYKDKLIFPVTLNAELENEGNGNGSQIKIKWDIPEIIPKSEAISALAGIVNADTVCRWLRLGPFWSGYLPEERDNAIEEMEKKIPEYFEEVINPDFDIGFSEKTDKESLQKQADVTQKQHERIAEQGAKFLAAKLGEQKDGNQEGSSGE